MIVPHAAPARRAGTRVEPGFTLIEMMIAMAMTIAVMGAILAMVDAAQGAFRSQGEVPDMQQRLRASTDLLAASLRMAGGSDAPVRPYRVGDVRDDGAAGVYYRPDTLTVFSVPAGEVSAAAPAVATRTYYLRSGAGPGAFDLMQYDGRQTDLPVVDHVVSLSFEYFGDRVTIDPAALTDGPWLTEASGRRTFDADLTRLRAVGVTLRVRSALGARLVPDLEIEFHVALRNRLPGA